MWPLSENLMKAISEATGAALEQLAAEFPTAVAKIKADFGPTYTEITGQVVETLGANPALLAQTDKETSIAEFVKVVLPVVVSTVKTFLV
jgi:hypothetical protein